VLLPYSPAERALCQSLLETLPSPSTLVVVGVAPHLLSLAGLFIYSLHGEVPLPHSPAEHATWGRAPPPFSGAQYTPPSLLHVLLFQLLIWYSVFFFFFAGWRTVCPGGYADFSQGWLWGYHMLLICSPVGLPSRLGAGAWQCGSPPGFSIYCGVGKLYVGWGCGDVRVLPLLGGFSCLVCLQYLRKIFTLRNTHYLLPPSSRHLGKSPYK
jgi:hypothetical protein